jgi:hypothetical protein
MSDIQWTDEDDEPTLRLRIGEDGHLTLKSEPKPCVPVTCPPERSTLLGVPEWEQGVRLPTQDE